MSKDIKLIQEDFFYDLDWDVNVATLFIEVLADQTRMSKFSASGDNKHAIQTTQYFVNKFFNNNFDLKECVKQTHKLQKRHATFSGLMLHDDIFWTKKTNILDCEQATWSQIIKDDPYAQAYTMYGDSHWDDFQVIFRALRKFPHQLPVRGSAKKLTISDDVKGMSASKFTLLDEVIQISSDKKSSLSTNIWNELQKEWDDSDEEGSFHFPSLKTEMSSPNPADNSKGKGKSFISDNICMSLYGVSYVSSSAHTSPNTKK